MGPAGAGSLAQVVNAALANTERFTEMREFFEGVGVGHAAGVWEDVPRDRPEFRAQRLVQLSRKARSEEAVGC
jgi:chlorophyllide a reductase subunit Y